MGSALDRGWRAAGTGFCFAVFGLFGLLQALLVFPLVLLLVRPRARRHRVGKRIMQLDFAAFVGLMRAVGVLTYETRHLERLDRPGLLVLANHPTLIDVVFLLSFLRRADCIVKSALFVNPFTRSAVESAGLIPNGLSGEALIERCRQSMHDGNSLVIFPEGSRSEPDALLPFQRGAAHIAVRAGRDVTPVLIRVSPHNLGRGASWWRVPPKAVHFVFEVQEDIPVAPFLKDRALPAAARALTTHLRDSFQQSLEQP